MEQKTSLCHWGAFTADMDGGRLIRATPWPGSDADPQMIGAWPDLVYSETRIDRPHIRKGFLERRHMSGGDGRGREDMVPVDWPTALTIVAEELQRVYASHGPSSVFGGSYGWASAGRFHHANSQLKRFLAAAGGFTDQIGNYSWGAAHAILPHILGSADAVSSAATGWDSIAQHSEVVVAFGGLNPKNWRVSSGGAGNHHTPRQIAKAKANGVDFIVISPFAEDIPDGVDALWIAPRPNSDTAIMLALAHQAVIDGRADHDFLRRHTTGHEAFIAYLTGETDGIAKTLDWAAGLSDVPLASLERLWAAIRSRRVMLTAAWSLQRADHGEQAFWSLIALAAMLGQIGLPGGGFSFGYGSLNGVGASTQRGFTPSMPTIPNPSHGTTIPAASFAEAFLNPGRTIDFNGRRVTFPDLRLVYWAGGNPFHHAQDLFRLEQAWRRPETIIVHEPWWTPTAKRADIVLPATTSAERNDIGGSSRDRFVFAMPALIEPVGQARNDFDILRDLSDRLGCRNAFDEGRDEEQWLRHLWAQTEAAGVRLAVEVPDFGTFWKSGCWAVPAPSQPNVLLSDFRADPEAGRLATPSGKIELVSDKIRTFGYSNCPPHPTWIAPHEWLGNAAPDTLHLVTNQPARRLHSQLHQVQGQSQPEPAEINTADAAERNINDGQIVRLWNDRGACLATAQVSDRIRRGVIIMATGAWFAPDRDISGLEVNGNPNVLTADRRTSSLGQACAALSALVSVEPHVSDDAFLRAG